MRPSLTAVATAFLPLFVAGCSQTTSPLSPSSLPSSGGGATVGALGSTGIRARVNAVEFSSPNSWVNVVVFIPRAINAAARDHGAPFGIQTSVTYNLDNGGVATLDSEPVSIAEDTSTRDHLDKDTDVIEFIVPFGTLPMPGNSPSFSGTAKILVLH